MKNNNTDVLKTKIAEFIIHNPALDTNFMNQFYGVTLREKDTKTFYEFTTVVKHRAAGLSATKISELTGIPKRKLEHWIFNENSVFSIRLLEHYFTLGKIEKSHRYLSINSTRGGIFTGPWITVPSQIRDYADVEKVLNQLRPITENECYHNNISKAELFAYFLGFLIGDSSKTGIKRAQRTTRRVQVRLSIRYPSNEKVGEFVSLCANSIGLRMERRKDCPAGKLNPYPFYTWISQSSPLIQWIFEVCLGLDNDMLTTYDPIRSDWILSAPEIFRIRFIQGLADSDGFVDFTARQAGIITSPNTELIEKILNSLNIKTTKRYFQSSKLWALMMKPNDAYKLPIFNEYIKSYRYYEIESLCLAKRYNKWPKEFKEKVIANIKQGYSGTELVRKILKEEGVLITTKHINKLRKSCNEETKK